MRIGYNTNGLAHHRLPDAIRLLASLGYRSVAISIDHAALNPYQENFERQLDETRRLLDELNMASVIETGARFLLDPLHKHQPTLVSPKSAGRPRRVEFLRYAVDIASALGSDCVSLWSGVLPTGDSQQDGFRRLVEGLQIVLEYADRQNVTLGFEPEPGMLINTMASFAELVEQIDSPRLGLTLDIGHLHCQGETPLEDYIRRWKDKLVNVHIEDMRAGVHEHLMFGEGEIDFSPVIAALAEIDYQGGLHVELSRHSHLGPSAAKQAYAFLKSQTEGVFDKS
ncbi:MAG: sugar phosphate isomerase/epimerase [Planctomycetes bacterium]|nr:sugar phosphate isomerase/epimerase [Planctomycetota bacterium]